MTMNSAELLAPASVNFLIGDADAGKGFVWCWLAAGVSTGDAPRNVLISDHFDTTATVALRLAAAGVDPSRIHLVDGPTTDLTAAEVDAAVTGRMAGVDVGLVIVDPWNRQEPVCRWVELAQRRNLAVLLVDYPDTVKPRDVAAAASVLTITRPGGLGPAPRVLTESKRHGTPPVRFVIHGDDHHGRVEVTR
ncbi:AAA family ATPase [Rhodococcus rhodochrous]|uniref:AAA family ATPase n=1 Tax=Rhodococcus rhodochrous TaxID=1829 RepID=UPI001E479E37|nr:AAA family ATPase [Rhodococcus rhodochrous]MCB8912200.1 AAA family ATPase [Rhodococcus rhodochrous]